MEEVTPCKGSSPFNEDTLLFTPLPQATSTVDKRPDLLPKPEIMMEPDKDSPEPKSSFLSDGLSALTELRLKLNSLCLNKPDSQHNLKTLTEPPLSNKLNSVTNTKETRVDSSSDVVDNENHQNQCNRLVKDLKDEREPSVSCDAVQSQSNVVNSKIDVSNCNFADVSLPVADLCRHPFVSNNTSLPAVTDAYLNNSDIVNLSLPAKSADDAIKSAPSQHLPSFVSSFTPLTQVSEQIKRNTFTLDVVGSSEDKERIAARQRALKIIGSLDVVPDREPDSSDSSIQSLQQKSFQPLSPNRADESGFSQLMSKSDFLKDESWCAANYGLPIKPGDESFSFLSASQVSLDFMPEDDSLLRELGSSDPPKNRRTHDSDIDFSAPSEKPFENLKAEETPKTSQTYCARSEQVRESSRNVKDLFSELDSSACSSIVTGDLDDYLKDKPSKSVVTARSTPELKRELLEDSNECIRVSEIAKALENIPIDATPNSLVKRVMELSDRPTTSNKSAQECGDGGKCLYQRTVVFGGIIHVDMPVGSSQPHTLWSLPDLDPTQVRAVIKSTTNPVKVLIFPLVRKNIVVKVCEVEFKKNDRYFERLHIIKLTVENPELEVVGPLELNFGLVPICGVVTLPLKIKSKNSNVLVVCPQIEQAEMSVFSVKYCDEVDEEIHLAPQEQVQLHIIIRPTVDCCSGDTKIVNIFDRLKLCLSPMLGSETLCQIDLKAQVFQCRLQVQDSVLEEPIVSGEKRQVLFKNSSVCSLNVKLRVSGQFDLSITSLTMQPDQISDVYISYSSSQSKNIVEGELILSIVPGDLDHFIKLKGKSAPVNSSFTSLRELTSARSSSASGSVNSTMSVNSSVVPEGNLQLECTSIYIAWPSIGLGLSNQSNQIIKSVYIRSKSVYKEKLLIEIDDLTNSFYLLTNEREFKKSEVVALKSHERKQIAVVFSPKILGQIRATIVIRRTKSAPDSDSKEITLFGFGGCANLRAHNIMVDLVTRQCKLSLQSNFTQQFSLQNVGDGIGFFSLSQGKLEGMHLRVNPVQGLIGPGEVRTISLILQPSWTGSEHAFFHRLLSTDKSTDILLSTLTIKYGDESTRLRLARLYRKYKNQAQFQKAEQVRATLKNIAELFPLSRQKVEHISLLKDPLSSLYDFYNEGVKEMNIDVITPRKTVEDANLEVTQQFVDFSQHSQLDDTEYTTIFDNTQPSHVTFN